jgi:hypothetical protein
LIDRAKSLFFLKAFVYLTLMASSPITDFDSSYFVAIGDIGAVEKHPAAG